MRAHLPASGMTNLQLAKELDRLSHLFDDVREGDHCGSPGEWMVERMGELETEQKRRMAAKR